MNKILLFILLLFIPVSANAGTNYCTDASGCWGMEYDTTTAEEDITANNSDLTVSTSDSIPRDADHKFGTYSRDFEAGDTDYLYQADGGSTDISGANASITIAAWIKTETIAGGESIVSKYTATNNWMQYLVNLNYPDNNIQLQACISSNGQSSGRTCTDSGTNYITANTWTHIAVVSNDTDIRLYINGSLVNTPAAHTAGIYNGGTEFLIGARGDVSDPANNPFDGLIDDVIIDNIAFDTTAISNIISCGIQGAECPASSRKRLVVLE